VQPEEVAGTTSPTTQCRQDTRQEDTADIRQPEWSKEARDQHRVSKTDKLRTAREISRRDKNRTRATRIRKGQVKSRRNHRQDKTDQDYGHNVCSGPSSTQPISSTMLIKTST